MVELKVYGARGSFGADYPGCQKYGNSTTCVGLWLDDEVIFFDAGTGLMLAQEDLVERKPKEVSVVLSHFHPDHFEGLGGTGVMYHSNDSNVRLYGSRGIFRAINQRYSGMLSPRGGLNLFGNVEGIYSLGQDTEFRTMGGQRIKPFVAGWHSVDLLEGEAPLNFNFLRDYGVQGFLTEVNGRKIAFTTDQEFRFQIDDDGKVVPMKNAEERKYRFVEAVRDADVLFIDGQFTEQEYLHGIVKGWGHASMEEALALAIRANIGKMVLMHHKPGRTDRELDDIQSRLSKMAPGLEVLIGGQGLEIGLNGERVGRVA